MKHCGRERMNEITCRVIDLPSRINAVTVVDENDDFNVYVNAKLSPDKQRRAYQHECRHIRKNHFYRDKAVWRCEQEANQSNPSNQ